jgi:Tol biopolymer transport system component
MPIEGGVETTVVASIACPDYAVGELGIYFSTPPDKKGRSDINLHEFQTGKTRKILTIGQPPSFIAASPDGRTILYSIGEQTGSDLMLIKNIR